MATIRLGDSALTAMPAPNICRNSSAQALERRLAHPVDGARARRSPAARWDCRVAGGTRRDDADPTTSPRLHTRKKQLGEVHGSLDLDLEHYVVKWRKLKDFNGSYQVTAALLTRMSIGPAIAPPQRRGAHGQLDGSGQLAQQWPAPLPPGSPLRSR